LETIQDFICSKIGLQTLIKVKGGVSHLLLFPLHQNLPIMGKEDKKGKFYLGSYGVSRPKAAKVRKRKQKN